MIKIPVSKIQQPLVREVLADIFWVENDEEKKAKISVFYFPLTVAADLERKKQNKQAYAVENGMVQMAEFCASRIEKIPAFVDDKDQPAELTKDFFESLHLDNLRNIFEAVMNDINPKSITSPSPNASKPTDEKAVSQTSAKKKS